MNASDDPPIDNDAYPPVIVITGATATGKSGLAVALGLQFEADVVNADSRYFYRELSIGVAKPTLSERQGVPHHLIDILHVEDEMSLALFQRLAITKIAEVSDVGGLAILAGGTPMYVNAVVEGWKVPEVAPHPQIRSRLEAEGKALGIDHLVERLRRVDPVAAERNATNLRRVIRALEVYEVSGKPMSAQEGKSPPPYSFLEIGLDMPREMLYQVIDDRVEQHLAAGLVDEVAGLLAQGVNPETPAFSAIGYRQLIPFLQGEQSLAVAVQQIKFDTHRYVRHQQTWLRRNKRLTVIDVSEPKWIELVSDLVSAFLERAAYVRATAR